MSSPPQVCPSCGAALRSGAKFCTGCGSKVVAAPVAAAPPSSLQPPTTGAPVCCAACGQPQRAGTKFCTACGASLSSPPPPTQCPSCGHPLRPGSKFCTECGTTIAAPASAKATSPEAPAVSICRACGAEQRPGTKFCTRCGASLAVPRRPSPGASVAGSDEDEAVVHCLSCGRVASGEGDCCVSCGAMLPKKRTPSIRRAFREEIGGPEPEPAPAPAPVTPVKAALRVSSTTREVDFGDAADAAPLAIADMDQVRTSAETPTSLRGRDSELAALQALLDAARQGASGGVLIVGERGLGKTRLLAEAASAARARGFLVAAARGGRFGVAVALDVFRQWLVAICDAFADGAYGAEQRHRASVASALGWNQVPALPAAQRRCLEQLFDGTYFEPAGDPAEMQQRMLAALIRALWTFAQSRPLCLLVDEADEADPASRDLWSQLVERLPDARLALVAAGAPELAEQGAGWARLVLSPLAEDDARALAEEFIDRAALPPELTALLAERAAGNPRLITAQMRELLERQQLVCGRDGWALGSVDVDHLLARPQDLTERQASRLDRQMLPGLQLAATIGQRVLRVHFDAACADLGTGAGRALDAAIAAGLLAACERSPNLFEFGQQGCRGDLLESVDDDARRNLQLAVVGGYRSASALPAALAVELGARHGLLADATAGTAPVAAELARGLLRRGLLAPAAELFAAALTLELDALPEAGAIAPDRAEQVLALAVDAVACQTAIDPAAAIALAPRVIERLRGAFVAAAVAALLHRHGAALAAAGLAEQAVAIFGRAVQA
ncbi:MAG: AAA family ATPase, partial [Deltaproteobacteria bacterium]|nr:AAA family ATPase [Deltaproteobacteria bacterium]